ncbi:hypothetical protein A2740_02345 [Candidatus Nomurabacteria bacterium RIFCSPHIGHO2_01_FULL_43_16]|nr:MAG: hypothetical protein A2740_02345 [Candidatus Nomurabacteria bacterium RIFCSPHIGHO2_01_FULL_43_16]OGI97387.1 MAG: hypothetical protein A3A11_02105 [Candidatus Nomurabacteria bacterium RIFCSPLOWO2_01_FULL_43_15]
MKTETKQCQNCPDFLNFKQQLRGCYGLCKKSYCILNKQYSKETYENLKEKIIERMRAGREWGQFFPKSMSPFAYNEAIANEYMPLSKEKAAVQGFRWQDDIPSTKGQGTMDNSKLPENPNEYNDNLTQEILTCEKCEKNYKLIKREIGFYKKNKLLPPRQCFNCRHALRMSKRNSRNLWEGVCAKCGNVILTSYKPEDQKIYKLYCEKCYQQEVY